MASAVIIKFFDVIVILVSGFCAMKVMKIELVENEFVSYFDV